MNKTEKLKKQQNILKLKSVEIIMGLETSNEVFLHSLCKYVRSFTSIEHVERV